MTAANIPHEIPSELTAELKQALLHEAERLRRSVSSLSEASRSLAESQGEESDAGGGMADVASDVAEQEIDVTLERSERERLRDVDAALRRIAEGIYGLCEDCGRPIDPERLRILPWTRYCVRCASRA